MKTSDPNAAVTGSGLSSISVIEGESKKLLLKFKNGTTLEAIPIVDENFVKEYEFIILTGREHKMIEKLKTKMETMQSQIQDIVNSDTTETTDSENEIPESADYTTLYYK